MTGQVPVVIRREERRLHQMLGRLVVNVGFDVGTKMSREGYGQDLTVEASS